MAPEKQLKQLSKSIPLTVRFRSISEDADFVRAQAELLKLPVIANERCGLWYVPPDLRTNTAYFKSTDGHVNEWAFNLRRLNLHVLDIIGSRGGAIIVDSCKKGKRMSDALSKTVPIWCCIMNRLLFPDQFETHGIELDPQFVPSTESEQIRYRLDGFFAAAQRLDLDTGSHRRMVEKPIKVEWVSPERACTLENPSRNQDPYYNHLYLCMASRIQDPKEDSKNASYVQGAGDDAETWARLLTPDRFWERITMLLGLPEAEIPNAMNTAWRETIETTVEEAPLRTVWPYKGLLLGNQLAVLTGASLGASLVIHCLENTAPETMERHGKRYVPMLCRKGKPGSRDLRLCLPRLTEAMKGFDESKPILICAPDKSDIGLAIAVAIACRYGTGHGTLQKEPRVTGIDKSYVKRELASISCQQTISQIPVTSLSRASLLAVHEYLIPPPESTITSGPQQIKAPDP